MPSSISIRSCRRKAAFRAARRRLWLQWVAGLTFVVVAAIPVRSEPARLLRQPTLSASQIVFAHGGDLWIVDREGGEARRLTSTPAVESDPRFSPDGQRIAFSSDRAGAAAVWVMGAEGGQATRLTWYPARSRVCGWTPDGNRVLYASSRASAPVSYDRLWTVAVEGGPSTLLPMPWGHDGAYLDATHLLVDRMNRWDVEWRNYRGGQNTPLVLLDLEDLSEELLPQEGTIDIRPVALDGRIYFLSDRDWTMNVWSWDRGTGTLAQLTDFEDDDVKWLAGHDDTLVFERQGDLHLLPVTGGEARRVEITLQGDFPWADTRWEDVGDAIRSASLSATGQRALFEARGEIFTVPAEKGSTRNLTKSSGAADRSPVWSPDGEEVAWVSDASGAYEWVIASQDGLGERRRIPLGESKMAWEATFSPDGERIAFVDDDVRIRVLDVASGELQTVDVGGTNIERGDMGLTWSPDGRFLAYSKSFANRLRRIVLWSAETGKARPITDAMANAVSPAWDRGGHYLYFLASTNLALGSGWANTSSMKAEPTYGAYLSLLRADDPTPFELESDEEAADEEESVDEKASKDEDDEKNGDDAGKGEDVVVDFDGIERRIVTLPVPVARYALTLAGPEGTLFLGVASEGPGLALRKFSLEDREAKDFVDGAASPSVSADGSKLLFRSGETWRIVDTASPPDAGKGQIAVDLQVRLDRRAEWRQMFEEAWRYQRDYFYDPSHHGRDWDVVHDRYAPLLPHIHHRSDLNYVLDQMNGELSVGHSFVFGGDLPETDDSRVGLLGADLEAHEGRWRIARIYTYESWNPDLEAPLDRPGQRVEEGHYLVGVEGSELTADEDPYRALDGQRGRQTVLHVNDRPTLEGSWKVVVEPIGDESDLRLRGWVEDNRRKVDELSGGRLAYVWVPDTSSSGVVSFDRYLFAQQDKEAAVIDERFNRGGLLDDYMVDLATRSLRAAITNEVPGGSPMLLPAGVLGPKVLLINELSGSGGDFFPWVWRHQEAGPLVGQTTWGGLVKSSVHYRLVDGGALTAPDNAVFDPAGNQWVGENRGIAPDVAIRDEAQAVAEGRDLQLEKAVEILLGKLGELPAAAITPPDFSTPALPPSE